MIFNTSANTWIFPGSFKNSNVGHVVKSGDKTDITNYRPISILNSFSKIFEKLVHSVVYTQVAPFINNNQHGFVKTRSTISNLMSFVDYTAESLDNN